MKVKEGGLGTPWIFTGPQHAQRCLQAAWTHHRCLISDPQGPGWRLRLSGEVAASNSLLHVPGLEQVVAQVPECQAPSHEDGWPSHLWG